MGKANFWTFCRRDGSRLNVRSRTLTLLPPWVFIAQCDSHLTSDSYSRDISECILLIPGQKNLGSRFDDLYNASI